MVPANIRLDVGALHYVCTLSVLFDDAILMTRYPVISNMREYDTKMASAFQSLERLADDEMPAKYRHRHCTSAGVYHKLAYSTFTELNTHSTQIFQGFRPSVYHQDST